MSDRIIKRYANRKMYDVENSRYVSLADIAEMVRSGENIRVISKSGDKDYTAKVLQQIILDQAKGSEKTSVSLLHEWVRLGGSFLDRQFDDFKAGMEKWIRKQVKHLYRGMSREDFDTLKTKVKELEKRVNEFEV